MNENRHSSHPPPRWNRILKYGLVLSAGVVLIGVIIWIFRKETPLSPTLLRGAKTPGVQVPHRETQHGKDLSPASPTNDKGAAASPATLESQLTQVIAGIREANQKKDLSQLLSHYSPNFPQLQQKVQNISKTWKIYDYPVMNFKITEVKLLANRIAQARVTWNVEAHNISNLKNKTIVKTYVIRFGRESNQWRIISLQPAE